MRRKSKRKVLKAIALSFAAAAVFTGTAVAGPTSPDSVIAEVPSDYSADWLSSGYQGVSKPDGYLPQHGGEEPVVIRDAPDGWVARTPDPVSVSASASSDGYDRDDLAIGFGLGLVLATACAAALAASRGRMRMAQS